MMTQTTTTLLILCLAILLGMGVLIFTWGKKTPGRGSWLLGAGILVLLTGIGLDSGLLLQEAFQVKIWMVGWVWSRGDTGAILVGVYQDALALCMSTLTALVSAVFLMQHKVLSQEANAERGYAALAFSTAGVAVAWVSLTPWLAFVGLVLTILGGVISLGSRWDSNAEAAIASRFIWERSSGFLLAFFGACILATSRSGLLLNQVDLLATQPENIYSTWIGSCLLALGLFVQMQPFPLLGWTVSKSDIPHPVRILLNQVFPAWAAFPLLLRLGPQFTQLGLFPISGWIALSSTLLIILSGLFQRQWRLGLSTWTAAGFSLSCTLLVFSGGVAGLGMLLGVSLAALCLAFSGQALEGEFVQNLSNKQRARWVKAAAFISMAGGTGLVGFVSATSGVRWIQQFVDSPGEVATFLFVFFLFVLLGWKQVWQILRLEKLSDISWVSIFSLFILIALSTGLVWTGTLTGEALIGSPDRLFGSLFNQFFGAQAIELSNSTDFISASGLYWGTLIFAFVAAYWTSGRKDDRWHALSAAMPKVSKFLARGYGVDGAVKHLGNGLVALGQAAERLVDQKIWTEWIPEGLWVGTKAASKRMNQLDAQIIFLLDEGLKKFVEVPAKLLQLIQTGDVRWYLFFSLGSGLALLSHFLKT